MHASRQEHVILNNLNFLISQPKHILWMVKRTVSMRWFFWAFKTYLYIAINAKENIDNFMPKNYVYLVRPDYNVDLLDFFSPLCGV